MDDIGTVFEVWAQLTSGAFGFYFCCFLVLWKAGIFIEGILGIADLT